jgi:hypothetical protein
VIMHKKANNADPGTHMESTAGILARPWNTIDAAWHASTPFMPNASQTLLSFSHGTSQSRSCPLWMLPFKPPLIWSRPFKTHNLPLIFPASWQPTNGSIATTC